MEFAFEVVGARRPPADAPAQQPMRPAKLVRNPDNDMKKARRQQARQNKKTAYGTNPYLYGDGKLPPPTVDCPICGHLNDGDVAIGDDYQIVCGNCGTLYTWNNETGDVAVSDARVPAYASKTAGSTWAEDHICPECGSDDVHFNDNEDSDLAVASESWASCADCGWTGSEDDLIKTSKRSPSMNREAQILQAMAKASLDEQRALALELDQIRRQAARRRQDERDLDLADAVVRDHLTPVMAFSRSTAATDWLDEVVASDFDAEPDTDVHQAMKAQATLWFRKVSSEVKADREEFAEQAMGMARRHAGAYGERAQMARRSFLDHVAHLHRVAESGSDLKADESGQGQSGLDQAADNPPDPEPFDADFWPDIDAEVSSERAPNIQENKDGKEGRRHQADRAGDEDYDDETTSGRSDSDDSGGGETCAVCGDAIERDPGNEDPQTWHHDNGEKHDHEAKPKGDSKESRRVVAEEGTEGLTPEEHAELENLRQQQWRGAAKEAKGWRVCGNCGGTTQRDGASCHLCGAKNPSMGSPTGGGYQTKGPKHGQVRTAADDWPVDPNDEEKADTDDWDEQATTGDSQDYGDIPGVKGSRRTAARSLSEIAAEIRQNWPQVNYAAAPYLDAMRSLNSVSDMYGADDAKSIVLYFLNNAGSWRGEVAQRVKAELRDMVKRGAKTAADPKADESGQGRSSLDQVEVGDENDRPMWPWELKDGSDKIGGEDAADVEDVDTPGGESGYPQPKKSTRAEEFRARVQANLGRL